MKVWTTAGTAALLLAAGLAYAQQPAPAKKAPAAAAVTESQAQANAILMRMADALAGAQRFSVSLRGGYDAVQKSGQKIEFGKMRKVTGAEINDIVSHEDWVPTLVAAAGEPKVKEKLLTGYQAAGKTFKVHLDGYDQRDLLAGTGPGKRKEFFYWTDDGNLAALRYDRWKMLFLEQRAQGLNVWQDPLVTLRLPKLIDLRADPFEIAPREAGDYDKWRVERAFLILPAAAIVAQHLKTYVEFPPRQKPGSFNLDQVLQKLQEGSAGKH